MKLSMANTIPNGRIAAYDGGTGQGQEGVG